MDAASDAIARFVETEEQPVPEGCEALVARAADGVRLRVARWPARLGGGAWGGEAAPPGRSGVAAAPRGTVVLMQGRGEFIEKYGETIEDLRRRGFAVVTFDWRGQGLSGRLLRDRRKGHVRDFREYRLDLEAVVAEAVPAYWPRPLFGLAHSMGGAVVLDALAHGFDRFARVALSAPMVDVVTPMPPGVARGLARSLWLAGLGRAYVPGGGPEPAPARPFEGNLLTADRGRYERTRALIRAGREAGLDVAVGDPTVGWVRAAFRLIDAMARPAFALAIATPVLVVAAGADRIVSTPAAERLAMRLKTGRAIVLPGARHEILMERDAIRDAFWAAFDAFIPGSAAEFAPEPLRLEQA